MDYVIRLALCGTVPRRLANIIPDDMDENEVALAFQENRPPNEDPPPLSTPYQMLSYFLQYQNIIDLLAIIPYYIEISYGGPPLAVFRVMRLSRVLLITKMSGASEYAYIMNQTILKSLPVLIPLCFFVMLIIIVMGCLIFIVEQGEYSVTIDYPNGAYLRPNIEGNLMEVSPYRTIADSIYFVVVTATTLGYEKSE